MGGVDLAQRPGRYGAGLTAVTPSFRRYVCREREAMFLKFATRVWGLELDFDHPGRVAAKCTEKGLVGWFRPLSREDVLKVLELAR